jgi:two-component system response regulator RegX3
MPVASKRSREGKLPAAPAAAGRIMLVEDEAAITDALSFSLISEGYRVTVARDGESALALPFDAHDLVILDLNQPGLSGFEVCRRIRERSIVPILMLTARRSESDRVLGLEIGADDFVSKPFSTEELLGRVRAVLRRVQMERARSELRIGELTLDFAEQTARIGEREVPLTQSEFRLLALLGASPGKAISRTEIVAHLWRSGHVGRRRTCDAHIMNLRRKIERDAARPERIVTVRGVGYMLRVT